MTSSSRWIRVAVIWVAHDAGHADEIQYHRDRATSELDLGLRAKSLNAARSHLRLSSLHFEKFKALDAVTRRDSKPRRPVAIID